MKANLILTRTALIAVLVLSFSSCYTEKKARTQFGKAVAAYPPIGAAFCDITYPPKILPGVTITKRDTVTTEGKVKYDTAYVPIFDTLYQPGTERIITKTLPGKVIRETITHIDTVLNTAALERCSAERGTAIENEKKERESADSWQKKAKVRFWVMLSLILLIVGWVGARIYSKYKK